MSAFPKIFPTCPICNGTKTIANLAYDEEIASGNKKIPIDTFKGMSVQPVLLVAPESAGLSIPALIVFKDICASCGTEWCTRIEKQNLPVTGIMRPPGNTRSPMGNFPFNKG